MMAPPRRLLALAAAPPGRVALSVGLGTATVLCGVGLMATAGYLISRAAERPAVLSLTVAIAGVRFFGITRPIARYCERLASHDVAFRVLGRVRVRVFRRIEPLAPAQLEGYRHGDLLSRTVSDVDALQNVHLRCVGPPLVAIGAGTVSVIVSAAILPSAAIVLACGLLVAGIAVPAVSASLTRRLGRLEAAARGELSSELVETVAGAAELTVYGVRADRLGRLRKADRSLVRVARRAALAEGAGEATRVVITGLTVTGVVAVAVSAHAAGHLDRVLIALLALLALATFEVIQPLAQAGRDVTETLAAGRRILDLTERTAAVQDPADPSPFPPGPIAVAFEGVRARYRPEEPPALDGFDLRLDPGRRIALIGPSGAGKTTVANLLVRFLDPEAGSITLAGRDLREYRQADVRHAIAVAGQESHLFSTSIRENVRLGRPDATEAEIEDAARRARILDWIRDLPNGWDTLVGEQGRQLSGGQRQRIVVARALLARAPVLVLDEPTAHLDPPTAERLIDDVLDAAGGCSVLLITHRPEGLDRMDEVVALP
jgi:thiol reductant ABC exporter CydC subunit